MSQRKKRGFRIPKFVSGALGGLAGAGLGFATRGPVGAITGGFSGLKTGLETHQKLKDAGLPFAGRRRKRKVTKKKTKKRRKRK